MIEHTELTRLAKNLVAAEQALAEQVQAHAASTSHLAIRHAAYENAAAALADHAQSLPPGTLAFTAPMSPRPTPTPSG